METKKQRSRKWLLPGVIAFLVLSVIFLNILILKSQNQVDILGLKEAHAEPPVAARIVDHPTASAKQTSKVKAPDNDPFASPFDVDAWDSFAEMQHVQEQVEHAFADAFGRFGQNAAYNNMMPGTAYTPKVDVDEKNDKYVLRFDLPGVDKGNVDVKVDGREVTVSGKRDDVITNKDDSGKVVRQERRAGSFTRSVELPQKVDATRMTASNDKGVFTIVLPKAS